MYLKISVESREDREEIVMNATKTPIRPRSRTDGAQGRVRVVKKQAVYIREL